MVSSAAMFFKCLMKIFFFFFAFYTEVAFLHVELMVKAFCGQSDFLDAVVVVYFHSGFFKLPLSSRVVMRARLGEGHFVSN